MLQIITGIIDAVTKFVPKLIEIAGVNLIKIINIIVDVVKGLEILPPEENAAELGNKALQAEEAGVKPENFNSYEEYLKTVENFQTDPERSIEIDENKKLEKSAEVITATLVERFGDPITALFTIIAKNPDYFEKRMPIFTEMQKSDPETFSDITRYMTGNETNIKKADETLGKIFEVEKQVEPEKTISDMMKEIDKLKD